MPRFEISWQVFGTMTVEADSEDDAMGILEDELFGGPDRDGLDYTIALVD